MLITVSRSLEMILFPRKLFSGSSAISNTGARSSPIPQPVSLPPMPENSSRTSSEVFLPSFAGEGIFGS